MIRPEGWERRLSETLISASDQAFHSRYWNCARFAHACAEAVSGRALPFRYSGSLAASVDAVFERHGAVLRARRGDLVWTEMSGGPSLGVCIGNRVAFVSGEGLINRPLRCARIAWMV